MERVVCVAAAAPPRSTCGGGAAGDGPMSLLGAEPARERPALDVEGAVQAGLAGNPEQTCGTLVGQR